MKILLYGAGRQGRSVLEILRAGNRDAEAFLDDMRPDASIDGVPIFVGSEELVSHAFCTHLIVSIGNAEKRLAIARRAHSFDWRFATAIHPTASIAPGSLPKSGSVVFPYAIIGIGAQVGHHCVINNHASVGHECIVMDGASINDGVRLGGGVQVGVGAFIGMNATILPDIIIGPGAIVGAGAVVTKNVPPGAVVAGVPARIIREGAAHAGAEGSDTAGTEAADRETVVPGSDGSVVLAG